MRIRNSLTSKDASVKLYKSGILAFNAKANRLITCDRMYVDWIGKKVIFTPTNANDGYSFKVTKGYSNRTICCVALKKILQKEKELFITENEDGSFWVPALEEAEE